MSHYHCEIILPPCKAETIQEAVTQVMAKFDEDPQDGDRPTKPDSSTASPELWAEWAEELEEYLNDRAYDQGKAFWDWYEIGGRWAGQHILDRFDPEILKRFHGTLADRKVTVSSIQFGKQELSPASQIPMVDALWAEMFPNSGLKHCPIFAHSNPLNHGQLSGDVCTVGELGEWAKAERLIIAGPTFVYNEADPDASYHTLDVVEPNEMWQTGFYNGVTWLRDCWDGLVVPKIREHQAQVEERWSAWQKRIEAGADDRRPDDNWRECRVVTDDWLAVTVDYHS